MTKTFKQELEDFNKTDFYLYRLVTASEVNCAAEYYEVKLDDNEYEIVCEFIYDWFTSTSASAQEICDHFFNRLSAGKFIIKDVIYDYAKVERIINDSF